MAKVAGPLFSMDASGKLADAIVYSKWKGRPYVRSLVIPANPKSVKQVSVRAMFKFLAQEWTNDSSAEKATWNKTAKETTISPFNSYMSYNQARWRKGLTPSRGYPATEAGGVGSVTFESATGGIRMATLAFDTITVQDNMGCLIARSTTLGFTPGFENVIAVINTKAQTAHSYVDTPLAAATYYYRSLIFSDDGAQKGFWEPEQSAIVTDT